MLLLPDFRSVYAIFLCCLMCTSYDFKERTLLNLSIVEMCFCSFLGEHILAGVYCYQSVLAALVDSNENAACQTNNVLSCL